MKNSILSLCMACLLLLLGAGCTKTGKPETGDDDTDSKNTETVVLSDNFDNNSNKWFVGTSPTNSNVSASIDKGVYYMVNKSPNSNYYYFPLSKNVFPDRAKKYIVECQLDGGGVEANKEGYYGLVFNLDVSIGRHTSLLLNNLHTFSVWQGKEDGTGGNKQLKGWTSFVRNPNAIGEILRIEVTSDGKGSFFLNNKLVFATTINNLKMDKIAFVVSNNEGLRSYYIKATVIK